LILFKAYGCRLYRGHHRRSATGLHRYFFIGRADDGDGAAADVAAEADIRAFRGLLGQCPGEVAVVQRSFDIAREVLCNLARALIRRCADRHHELQLDHVRRSGRQQRPRSPAKAACRREAHFPSSVVRAKVIRIRIPCQISVLEHRCRSERATWIVVVYRRSGTCICEYERIVDGRVGRGRGRGRVRR
jgi:hypothetical protein